MIKQDFIVQYLRVHGEGYVQEMFAAWKEYNPRKPGDYDAFKFAVFKTRQRGLIRITRIVPQTPPKWPRHYYGLVQ